MKKMTMGFSQINLSVKSTRTSRNPQSEQSRFIRYAQKKTYKTKRTAQTSQSTTFLSFLPGPMRYFLSKMKPHLLIQKFFPSQKKKPRKLNLEANTKKFDDSRLWSRLKTFHSLYRTKSLKTIKSVCQEPYRKLRTRLYISVHKPPSDQLEASKS